MSEREKVIDKIRKLRAMAEGAGTTEQEAMAFAAKMQQLMSEHKVLMDEVERARENVTDPISEIPSDNITYRDGRRVVSQARIPWQEYLASVVARAHYCRHAVTERTATQWFIGRRSDAEAAKMTFDYLLAIAGTLAWEAYKKAYADFKAGRGPWEKGFQRCWLLGFAQRLSQRYNAEMDAMKAKWANSGTALMRLRDAMTVVDEYIANKYKGAVAKEVRKGEGTRVTNHDAFKKGRDAADAMKLRGESSKLNSESQRKLT